MEAEGFMSKGCKICDTMLRDLHWKQKTTFNMKTRTETLPKRENRQNFLKEKISETPPTEAVVMKFSQARSSELLLFHSQFDTIPTTVLPKVVRPFSEP